MRTRIRRFLVKYLENDKREYLNQTLCRREDLNLHGLPRLLLRQVRLPISPPRHIYLYYHNEDFIHHFSSVITGAPSRDRTYDLILKRDLLYQLSYGRIYLFFQNFCILTIAGLGLPKQLWAHLPIYQKIYLLFS